MESWYAMLWPRQCLLFLRVLFRPWNFSKQGLLLAKSVTSWPLAYIFFWWAWTDCLNFRRFVWNFACLSCKHLILVGIPLNLIDCVDSFYTTSPSNLKLPFCNSKRDQPWWPWYNSTYLPTVPEHKEKHTQALSTSRDSCSLDTVVCGSLYCLLLSNLSFNILFKPYNPARSTFICQFHVGCSHPTPHSAPLSTTYSTASSTFT